MKYIRHFFTQGRLIPKIDQRLSEAHLRAELHKTRASRCIRHESYATLTTACGKHCLQILLGLIIEACF